MDHRRPQSRPGPTATTARWWATLALVVPALAVSPGQADARQTELSARVWLDRGEEPVLTRGERVRLYYRTNADAFVAIFQVDTNGTVRLLFPRSPDENHYVRGGQDYRLLFPRSSWWSVDDDPGVGYFFAVASPEPFAFESFQYSHFQGGWDLSFVGRAVYSDPYAAMDDYIARLIPDWEYVPYALDFTSYHVERRYEYPRFLCYDCHGFRPYSAWNPYFYTCSTYRVVVYNDPYYYPVNRYRGDRVVWVRPAAPFQPRFVFKERGRGEPGTPVVAARPEPGDRSGVRGTAVPRRSTEGIGSGGVTPAPRSSQPGSVQRPLQDRRALPGQRPAPSANRPTPSTSRPAPPTRPSDALPDRRRPVLERRPPARGGVPTRGGSAAPTRPSSPPSGAVVPRRPPTGGGAARSAPPRGGSNPPARPPAARRPPGGGSNPPARLPTARKPRGGGGGGAASPARPPARVTPPRGGGGGTPARPPARVTPPRGGGGNAPARPTPTRRPGGGGEEG